MPEPTPIAPTEGAAETPVTEPAATAESAGVTPTEPTAEGSAASDPAPQVGAETATLAQPESLLPVPPKELGQAPALADAAPEAAPSDAAPEADAETAQAETPVDAPAETEVAQALPEPVPPVEPPTPDLAPQPPEAEAPADAPARPEPQPEALPVDPEAPIEDVPVEEAPSATTPEPEAPETGAPDQETPAAETPAGETPDSGMVPLPEEPADRLPGTVASEMPGTRPAGLPGTAPEPDSALVAPPEPAPGISGAAEGVVVGRLPRIGSTPAPDAATEPATTDVAPTDDRPLAQFAATFENPDAKPLVAIVLIDTGATELDRAGLAALPFPVSFALDPLDPATPDHAALYRAAGKEVVMLATGLPEGAQPSDVEVAFQSMAQNLPEAVAVMDLAAPMFQNNRPLASLVVPVIQGQGRGLLTWDAGLNAADQVARREDVPAATLFRDLAAGGTDRFALRRSLERVVFKAGQDGRVAVAAAATPELVAGLLEWTIEGRGATVALAPVTAVLTVE